jgi:hypothetical protein
MPQLRLADVIPGGVRPTDHWHRGTNAPQTCSRCRSLLPEHEVPLMLWSDNGDMLIYCEDCLGV